MEQSPDDLFLISQPQRVTTEFLGLVKFGISFDDSESFCFLFC